MTFAVTLVVTFGCYFWLELGIGMGDLDRGNGIGDWNWGLGLGIGDWGLRIEIRD